MSKTTAPPANRPDAVLAAAIRKAMKADRLSSTEARRKVYNDPHGSELLNAWILWRLDLEAQGLVPTNDAAEGL